MKSFTLTIHEDAVAELVFDHPEKPVNIFDSRSLAELEAVVENLERDRHVKALLFRSAKKDFIAGADVRAIAAVQNSAEGEAASRRGQALFERIARLAFPSVAAVHGLCLGGGTELALACRFRVASDSRQTLLGLPEVQLGILPAWGGTQRLPRLVGLPTALDMILSGHPLNGRAARRIGLVDEILPAENFDEQALAWLRREVLDARRPPRRLPLWRMLFAEGNPAARAAMAALARRVMLRRTGGHYPAAGEALRLAAKSFSLPMERGLAGEAGALGRLVETPAHKNLLRLFFLREEAKKTASGAAVPREVRRLGVLGAGVMGGGIAALAARRGIEVRLRDLRQEALTLALRTARHDMDEAVRRGRMTPCEAERAMARISPALELSGFEHADMVIEAVVERIEVKQAVFREIETCVPRHCVLASNTSALPVAQMAAALRRPERLVGLHFFNPVSRMPLAEVIRHPSSSEETVSAAMALAGRLEKFPVAVKDSPGFLVNRLLAPYMQEAALMAEEGVSVEAIDRAMKNFGMPMGPFELYDEVGLDVAAHVAGTLRRAWPQRFVESNLVARLAESGGLGKKSGRGFYEYKDGKKRKVSAAAVSYAKGLMPSPEEITARLLYPMVNEAARCADERVAENADKLDFAMVMGTGFAPFRGGPMRWAETEIGFKRVVEALQNLAERHGARLTPSAALRGMG